ncbi:hypothetical protein PG984_005016 [Apiospora sp. TS-2023a]
MSSHRFAVDEDEQWAARSTDASLRRKVQNRLNQRALLPQDLASDHNRRRRVELRSRPLLPRGAAQEQPSSDRPSEGRNSLTPPRQINALQLLSPSLEDYHTRKNFFLAYTIQWPKYNVPGGEFSPASFFHLCIRDPLLLHTVVNGIAIYRLSTSQYYSEDLQTFWNTQNQVSCGVRAALAAGVVSDAVLNAVRVLGTRITVAPPGGVVTRGYFSSVGIESVGGLELEGLLDFADDHYLVLAQLVEARGGLIKVQLPGIAEKINRVDVLRASLRNEQPLFDLPRSAIHVLQQELESHRFLIDGADAFHFVEQEFKAILMDLRHCCVLIEAHLERTRSGLPSSLGSLGHCRDIVQNRLLSLPPSRGAVEIARLAALAFTYGVTYPLPRPSVNRRTCTFLLRALAEAECSPELHDDEFLLWAAMIGALGLGAAEGTSGFVRYLRCIAERLGLMLWEDVKIICEKFIWLGPACNDGAALIWAQVTF